MHSIKSIRSGIVNVYLVQEGNHAILIDTGMPAHKDKVLRVAREAGVRLILLTHGHMDHVANVKYLADSLNVPVALHSADAGLLTDQGSRYLHSRGAAGGVLAAGTRMMAKQSKSIIIGRDILPAEELELQDYGIQGEIVMLPGHTAGSIGVLLWGTDIIVGDALMHFGSPSASLIFEDE